MYREILLQSRELQEDLYHLYCLLAAASEYYDKIYERNCEMPGWLFVHSQLDAFALGNPEVVLGVLPSEAEKPE